jgi:ABC-type transport system substrate-binding protein
MRQASAAGRAAGPGRGRWAPARLVAVACLAAVAGAAAGGCTPGGPPPVVDSEVARTSAPPPNVNELIIGVDDLGTGFNPHSLADVGPVSLGVAGLVLPSVFRQDAGGVLRLDQTWVGSAEVTAQQPFTVTYQLRREASWSDGAPIAAEDFAYLAERMRTEPGVVSPAGYRLIGRVDSRAGGKQVEVVFERPYPGWRSLFADLLPAHLFKDAPGGWAQALESGIPVSGGPFAMRAVDPAVGTVVLERNDRYWGVPAAPDRLVLRRADQAGLVSALATGGDQLAVLRADAIGLALLRERAPQLVVRPLPEPVAAELLLRPAGPRLSDRRLRLAAAAALDRDDLVRLGSGSGPAAALPAAALTLLPSEPGYDPTRPAPGPVALGGLPAMRADAGEVAELLTSAGYRRIGTQWVRGGRPLRLVVAAPAERAVYRSLAGRVVRELTAAGIGADLITPTGDELFAALAAPRPPAGPQRGGSRASGRFAQRVDSAGPGEPPTAEGSEPAATPAAGSEPPGAGPTVLSSGPPVPATSGPTSTTLPPQEAAQAAARGVDIAVVPRPVTGDPAADLVSWYGCPAGTGGAAAGTGATDGGGGRAANPAGYCNRDLQASMDDLLTGAVTFGDTLAATEAALWHDLPCVPLFQHAVVLVSGPTVDTVRPGALLAGPFAGAAGWRRAPR